ncbi:MAG TPA: sulfite exporter TauE/SafE family protein [Puia sp.]|nr:sulfite exporter TauE/SafE family protein [Puia sp.]
MSNDLVPFAVIIISFIATLVRSTFGFGESLVAVPLFVLFIPLDIAVPLSVLISILVAAIVVVQDHRQIHIQSAKWLILYAFLGIPIGLMILIYGNAYWVKIGLGVLIIGYSVYTLLAKGKLVLEHDSRGWLFACGFFSGILGGAYGLNGPPLVVYGNMRKWSPQHFRATLQAYFLPASLVGVIGYAIKGLLGWEVLRYFLLCLPVVIPSVFLGRRINRRLHGAAFFKYIYWGLIGIGGILIVFTVWGVKI